MCFLAPVVPDIVETDRQIRAIEHKTKLLINEVSSQEELDQKIAEAPDEVASGIKFCLHDLRRTFITVAESTEVSYASLQKLLNHSSGSSITSSYIQITTERLREPMERISRRLLELMQPSAEEQQGAEASTPTN